MANNLVGYSRAGDAFHYRWAARRSLKLIFPNTALTLIVIEGSKEDHKAGEYVIDLTEYYGDQSKPDQVIYYQLKHTTKQLNKPFKVAELKDTFTGFGERFLERNTKDEIQTRGVNFSIITNRPFDADFKRNLSEIAAGTCKDSKFIATITRYTKLKPQDLKTFCSILNVDDSLGDYIVQKQELRVELNQILAGSIDNAQISSLISLMSDKVLPDNDGSIVKEEVLKCFEVREDELYPAPPVWEPATPIVVRQVYDTLRSRVLKANQPLIIHAEGGAGKSVFAKYLSENSPEGVEVVAYDCFGAGSYRNRSKSRHRHHDALVQIANELATKGLCDPLIPLKGSHEKQILIAFFRCLDAAVNSVKKAYSNGGLLLIIDAADNAEMAAEEAGEPCFAGELLKETIPDGCRIVFLCRPERIHLLDPPGSVVQLPLPEFSRSETFKNLQLSFPGATPEEGDEFHRLTSGNPRVQANALTAGATTIQALLEGLGPDVITVEAQIAHQLTAALNKLKDNVTPEHRGQIHNICLGLASLSPNIPIEILAKVSSAPVPAVRSFISDIGRSLWQSDNFVQFRDEPTETWFKNSYSAITADLERFIAILEPLADDFVYVAQVLPQLYLKAGKYPQLIKLALSEEKILKDNPIDERSIRVFRLQFALKAALKAGKFNDACKLALRAGEEVAGNERQSGLLKQNIDLLTSLQDRGQIQYMAMRREIGRNWQGSENIYSAALLSGFDEFKGEARIFLRSAENWFDIFIKGKNKENGHDQHFFNADVLELAHTYLKLDGPDRCIKFLKRIRLKSLLYKISGKLASRLIDSGDFDMVSQLLKAHSEEPYFVLALNTELVKVGRFCEKAAVTKLVKKLNGKRFKLESKDDEVHDNPDLSVISLVEAAIHYQLPEKGTSDLVARYLPSFVNRSFDEAFYRNRNIFILRSFAVRHYLSTNAELDIDRFIPSNLLADKLSYEDQKAYTNYKELIGGLVPWYVCRLNLIANGGDLSRAKQDEVAKDSHKALGQRYRYENIVPETLSIAYFDILKFSSAADDVTIKQFYNRYIKANKSITTGSWISAVRWACRLDHLEVLRDEMEEYAFQQIRQQRNGDPEELSEYYVTLARAAIVTARDNAVAYFDSAVEVLTKFGEETIRRWEAVTALAKQALQPGRDLQELSYRLMRIAELVGQDRREKHWDREFAIELAIGLSVTGGIAAVSRWRDREIGRFQWAINVMLITLLESRSLSPLQAWALSPLSPIESLPYLVKGFLKSSVATVEEKSIILEDAVRWLRRDLMTDSYWYDLDHHAREYGLKSAALNRVLMQIPQKEIGEKDVENKDFMPDLNWEKIIGNKDLMTPSGITAVHDELNKAKNGRHFGRHVFCKGIIGKLKAPLLPGFIRSWLECEWAEHYDVASFFEHLPEGISARPGFIKELPSIVEAIGIRFALELITDYSFKLFVKVLPGPAEKIDWLKKGIAAGMVNSQEFATGEELFDLVRILAKDLTSDEATATLDYALERFDIHTDEKLADGPFMPWMVTKDNAVDAVGGFLWSALASPDTETRWRTAHCVKKAAELGQGELIDALFNWANRTDIGAFGCNRYPFYERTALQYLLIASARISLEHPEMLERYAGKIAAYATGYEHIVIQRFAADTALRLALKNPSLFQSDQLVAFNLVGAFPLASPEDDEKFGDDDDWDEVNLNDLDEDAKSAMGYDFGYDFGRYWLGDLADEFNLSQRQIVDMAAAIIAKEWKISKVQFNDDPRSELWNNSRSYSRTSHSHGSYPREENYDFYLSYHAMMTVASRLLKMVSANGTAKGKWDWLSSHMISRSDGFWLSDWKDDIPLDRPEWGNEDFKVWETNIEVPKIIKNLLVEKDGVLYLTVAGTREEQINSKRETYSIHSALVKPDGSEALLAALSTCDDPYNFKLPNYREQQFEFRHEPFELTGWMQDDDCTLRIDEYDPFFDRLPVPPLKFGKDLADELELVTDEHRVMRSVRYHQGYPAAFSEQWSNSREERDEEPDQRGRRLNCSLNFLAEFCKMRQVDIIIEVKISRKMSFSYRSISNEKYKSPVHKIFILSANGEIRDTESNYQLRKVAGERTKP